MGNVFIYINAAPDSILGDHNCQESALRRLGLVAESRYGSFQTPHLRHHQTIYSPVSHPWYHILPAQIS